MSADQLDRTRAVTTRLAKRNPTNRKSVRERLRKISLVGFREGRNVGRPTRSDTGRHDPSSTEEGEKFKLRKLPLRFILISSRRKDFLF